MITKRTAATVAALIAFMFTAGLSAKTKTLSPGDDLSQIVNHTSADVKYTVGKPHVEISGPESVLRYIKVGVANRCLKIQYAGDHQWESDVVEIKVSAENVGSFIVYGSGDIKADRIEAVSVSLQTFGSGDITVGDVSSTGIQIGIYGSGDITVNSAEASTVKALIQGSGDVTVRKIEASSVEATSQGSGDHSHAVGRGVGAQGHKPGFGRHNTWRRGCRRPCDRSGCRRYKRAPAQDGQDHQDTAGTRRYQQLRLRRANLSQRQRSKEKHAP